MIKCATGLYYDTENDIFEVDEWCKTLTTQDLADAISVAHAEKVKRDNAVRAKYASNKNSSNAQEESR